MRPGHVQQVHPARGSAVASLILPVNLPPSLENLIADTHTKPCTWPKPDPRNKIP
jgi:hypothetical protein